MISECSVFENIISFVFSGGLVTKHMTKTLAYIPKYNYFKLVSFNESLIIIIMIRDLLEVNYFIFILGSLKT